MDPLNARTLAEAYLRAKRAVVEAGYDAEIAWQEDACEAPMTECRFLSEAAWVVLSAGMKEAIVRRIFPNLRVAFADFASADAVIAAAAAGAKDRALCEFRHPRKIGAIIEIAEHVRAVGFAEVKRRLSLDRTDYLQTLPYIGPITAFHLAKNLGQDVAKPDRHLMRIARACGYETAEALCVQIRNVVAEPVAVIDVVLWRFATLSPNYVADLVGAPGIQSFFRPGSDGGALGGSAAGGLARCEAQRRDDPTTPENDPTRGGMTPLPEEVRVRDNPKEIANETDPATNQGQNARSMGSPAQPTTRQTGSSRYRDRPLQSDH